MNGFATKVTRSFAFLGSSLLAAQTPASSTIDIEDSRSVSIGGGDDSNRLSLQDARLYVSGAASETI